MANLRTLTAEELERPFGTYTIEDLRIGMECRVRDPEFTGQIGVIVCINQWVHEEVTIKFPIGDVPFGPWRPNEIHILESSQSPPSSDP